MSEHTARQQPVLLNALLGMALAVAAGLNIALLGAIGWSTWQRATLAERWQALQPAPAQAQNEAGALREAAAGAEHAAVQLQQSLASDADVARFVAGIPATATAWGVSVIQLSPQATTTALPLQRSFLLRAQGSAAALQSFLVRVTETAPAGARSEQVSLQLAGDPCVLMMTLIIPIRGVDP